MALAHRYSNNRMLTEQLWQEIETNYSGKKRYYHNLSHLDNLLSQINEHKELIIEIDAVLFAVFYHDAVYDTLRQDNEEKSAELAGRRMKALNVPVETSTATENLILATKAHSNTDNGDINLFTDADLSILGAQPTAYEQYCQQIRKEYAIYPDIMYKPGRRKVLKHFLQMDRIYKTTAFYGKYERQARENMSMELEKI